MLEHTSQAPKPREDMAARMVQLPLFRVREGGDHYDRLLALERQRRGEFQERWDSGKSRV
jgi:hypothetical protein